MAEKKVLEEICPCGGHRAEVWVDVEANSRRLDFVDVEEIKKPKKPPEKPVESEDTFINRTLFGG